MDAKVKIRINDRQVESWKQLPKPVQEQLQEMGFSLQKDGSIAPPEKPLEGVHKAEKTSVTVTAKTFSSAYKPPSGVRDKPYPTKKFACQYCGYSSDSEFDACPNCGKEIVKDFMDVVKGARFVTVVKEALNLK